MTTPSLPADTPRPDAAQRQRLSSLADADWAGLGAGGRESDGAAVALDGWRQEAAARQTWHTYHLIGDVMRSDDLARPAQQDQDFLNRLRIRLEAEPAHEPPSGEPKAKAKVMEKVVAFPVAVQAQKRESWSRWQAGAALAASVAVVAVVLSVNQTGRLLPGQHVPVVAGGAAVDAAVAVALKPTAMVQAGVVLRDPRLDEFLRLHQMARGGLPMGAPGGTLQRADLQMPAEASR